MMKGIGNAEQNQKSEIAPGAKGRALQEDASSGAADAHYSRGTAACHAQEGRRNEIQDSARTFFCDSPRSRRDERREPCISPSKALRLRKHTLRQQGENTEFRRYRAEAQREGTIHA